MDEMDWYKEYKRVDINGYHGIVRDPYMAFTVPTDRDPYPEIPVGEKAAWCCVYGGENEARKEYQARQKVGNNKWGELIIIKRLP